jgi:hypothetical protein
LAARQKNKIAYMKTLIRLFILSIFLHSCSVNRYLLTDEGKDKRFLINTINESFKSGKIQKKPIIVVDGKPYRYDYELKSKKLQLSKNDIRRIDILEKDVGIEMYGDYAENGVIILSTQSNYSNDSKSFSDSKVLILLEDKEISKDEMEKISPRDIISIDVIKDKEIIKKYTSEAYDGVIVIHIKKD